MSKFLFDTSLSDVLPHSISHDEGIQAGSAAVQPELAASTARIACLLLYSRLFDTEKISENASEVLQRISSLGGYYPPEESLLDLLAWQFHVDEYDIAKTYAEKLAMVKASIQIHRKKGTKWAVKRAVEAALQDTELKIKEWFESNYNSTGSAEPRSGSETRTTFLVSDSECQEGCLTERHGEEWFEADYANGESQGNPYHFRAELMVLGEEVLADHIARAKRIIESTKSLRSHCDGVTVAIGSYGESGYGFYTALANTVTIEPELVTELETEEQQSRQGQAMHTESILSVYPNETEENAGRAKIFVVYPN